MNKKKSFWSLLTIMMVSMLSVGFVSCSSDDDEEEQSNILFGTKWQAEETLYPMMFGGGKTYAVIDFSSKNECEMYLTQQGNIVHTIGNFTYSIQGTEVTYISNKDGYKSVYTIDGRKMTSKSGTIYSNLKQFIKQ